MIRDDSMWYALAGQVERILSVLRCIPTALAGLTGWRGALAVLALGALTTTALPPLNFLPGLLAFSALFWRLDVIRGARSAAVTAWLFAFGYHLAGLYWISNALLVHGDRFAWLVPFAAAGIPAALALFPALLFAFLPWISSAGPMRTVAAAGLWCLAEYARGNMFTGLPWNLPAYSLSGSETMSQGAAWFGAYGLSLLVMLAAIGPALLIRPSLCSRRFAPLAGMFCLSIPLVLWGAGSFRLHNTSAGFDSDVVIRVVQGNIPQKDKWNRALRKEHLARYSGLSTGTGSVLRVTGLKAEAMPTVIIWPETAVPAFLAGDPALRSALAGNVPYGGSLVTGAPTLTDTLPKRLYNSMIVMRADGSIAERYDKSHLVPFGEYVPARSWLPLPRVVQSATDFSAGSGRRTLEIAGLGMTSPLICYEVIFPGAVVAAGSVVRPDVLLNLTNDGWYGRSSGPWQHSAIARMRAIEEGLPLIRAANTGISGVYDAFGRTLVEIPLEQTGAADSYLPRPVDDPTLFVRLGNLPFLVLLLLLLVFPAVHRLKRENFSQPGAGSPDPDGKLP